MNPQSTRTIPVKTLEIGLLGLGNVGLGVARVLHRNREEITRRSGVELRVTRAAVRNLAKAQASVADLGITVGTDPFAVVDDPSICIVAELMGGTDLAKTLVLRAIHHGKHVVTANKALLALHGNELFAAAEAKGVMLMFEAAVAGGIPIIKALREGLSANRIEWLAGIINGTSNFILTEMRSKGLSFAVALEQAQTLGYAEADPTFDIEGQDAAHKLMILAAIAFGVPMGFEAMHIEGITQLSPIDFKYAEQLGYRIKLLGIARRGAAGVELRVHPTLVPATQIMAKVEGVMNAVLVHGDAVGHSFYSGRGAGSEPTASAVIADLLDMARLHDASAAYRVPALGFQPSHVCPLPVLPISAIETCYYLRLAAQDQPGVMASITGILAELNISIDAMLQKEPQVDEAVVDVVILTHKVQEAVLDQAIARLQALPTLVAPVARIRLETLEG